MALLYNKEDRRKRYLNSTRKHKEEHIKKIKAPVKEHRKNKKDYFDEDIDGEIS